MSFLLDSDTCSAHLKQAPALTGRLLQYGGRLYISSVSVGELYTWALRRNAPPQRLRCLQDLLRDVTTLDVTPEVARKFGEVRAHLLDIGSPAPNMDLLIAATALVHNLTLITHNTSDFSAVPNLVVDDWLRA